MSEITEQEAREAAVFIADIGNGANEHAPKLLAALMMNILSRRDAERAARQQPITPEWCIANGAKFCEPYCVFEDKTRVMLRLLGHASLVFVNGQMLDWSAECVGQVDDLRRALRGGV